ncbi:MAG: hypothetical protein PHO08_05505 [Methylococcales bacterium]|nr:hypothetical protein [Methylococcales bacterium]MDD5631836.1 hypothetical protein [Methylococcales bacterium]
MNTQVKKIVPLMLLLFFGSAQAKLVNSNVDILSNESNLKRISRTPAVIGDQSFLTQAVFVSKAIDTNNLDTRHTTPIVEATAFNADAIDTNDLTKESEYFNERRVAMENILELSSNAFGGLLLIAKKAIILSLPSASLIPSVSLTTTVWMFGIALMGFLAYCKRNNAI